MESVMVSKASTGGRRVRAVCRLLSSAGSPALLLGVASLIWLLGLLLHPAGSVGAETQPRLVAATDAGTAGADGSGSGSEPSTDGSPGKPAGGGSSGSGGSGGSTGSGDSGSGGASSQDGSGTAEQPSTDGAPAKPAGASNSGTSAQPDSGSSSQDQCASGCGPRPTPAQPSSTGPAADQVDQTSTPPRSPDRPRPGQGNPVPATDRAPADSEACRAGGGTDCASPRVGPVNNLAATGSAEPNPGDPETCAPGRTDCVRPPGPPAGAAQASTRTGTETADGQSEACPDGGPGCTNPLAVMAARTTSSNPAGLDDGIGEPDNRRGCGPGLPCPDQPATPGAPASPGGPSSAGSGGTGGAGPGGGSGAGVPADRAADPELLRATAGATVPREGLSAQSQLPSGQRAPPVPGTELDVLDDLQRQQLAALIAPGQRYPTLGSGSGIERRDRDDTDLEKAFTTLPRPTGQDVAIDPRADTINQLPSMDAAKACNGTPQCMNMLPRPDGLVGAPRSITCEAGGTACTALGQHDSQVRFTRESPSTPAQIAWNSYSIDKHAESLSAGRDSPVRELTSLTFVGGIDASEDTVKAANIVRMRERNRDLAQRYLDQADPANRATARELVTKADQDLAAARARSADINGELPGALASSVPLPVPGGPAAKPLIEGSELVVDGAKGALKREARAQNAIEDSTEAATKQPVARSQAPAAPAPPQPGATTGLKPGDPLGPQHSPDFVVHPNGEIIPVPKGAVGPTLADNKKGFQFQGGSGGHGLDPRTSGVRIMDPATKNKHQHPHGYIRYNNDGVKNGGAPQSVNPWTGRTVATEIE